MHNILNRREEKYTEARGWNWRIQSQLGAEATTCPDLSAYQENMDVPTYDSVKYSRTCWTHVWPEGKLNFPDLQGSQNPCGWQYLFHAVLSQEQETIQRIDAVWEGKKAEGEGTDERIRKAVLSQHWVSNMHRCNKCWHVIGSFTMSHPAAEITKKVSLSIVQYLATLTCNNILLPKPSSKWHLYHSLSFCALQSCLVYISCWPHTATDFHWVKLYFYSPSQTSMKIATFDGNNLL